MVLGERHLAEAGGGHPFLRETDLVRNMRPGDALLHLGGIDEVGHVFAGHGLGRGDGGDGGGFGIGSFHGVLLSGHFTFTSTGPRSGAGGSPSNRPGRTTAGPDSLAPSPPLSFSSFERFRRKATT